MTTNQRRTGIWFGVGITVVALAAFLGNYLPPGTAGQTDFVEYAAAARLLNDGENPYDARRLLELQRTAGWEGENAQMMWNPPWAFPLVLPAGWLDWPNSFLAWSAIQSLAVAFAVSLIWRSLGGLARFGHFPILLALAFAPTIFLARLGQISGFILLGLAGFLTLRDKRPALAGIAAAVAALKPHLLLPFAVLLIYDGVISSAGRRVLLAGAVVLILAALFPLPWNPDVWQQYIAAVKAPTDEFHSSPSDWQAPTFAASFRGAVGGGLAVQFLPSILATLGLLGYRFHRGAEWDWSKELPLVTMVAVLTSGYGAWGFDLVVLLLPVLQAAVWLIEGGRQRLSLWTGVGFLLFNAAMLMGLLPVLWWSPGIAVGYFALTFTRLSSSKDRAPASPG